MDPNSNMAILSVAVSAIGIIVTIACAIGGFAYKTLNSRITDVKSDGMNALASEERRRQEAIRDLTALMNSHYMQLRADLAEFRAEVRLDIQQMKQN